MSKIMVFPSDDFNAIKLMQVPDDFEEHEVYRHVTALISDIQEQSPDCSWEDVEERLQEHGFNTLNYILGPALQCHSDD